MKIIHLISFQSLINLIEDILEKNYDKSYANPVYAVKVMGLEYGRMLSFLYVELRGMIAYAYELRIAEMTVLMELFVEIYCSFESETPDSTSLRDIIYWYVSDYSDDFVEYRVREQIDTSLSFATDIIKNENLDETPFPSTAPRETLLPLPVLSCPIAMRRGIIVPCPQRRCSRSRPPRRYKRNLFALLHAEAGVPFQV